MSKNQVVIYIYLAHQDVTCAYKKSLCYHKIIQLLGPMCKESETVCHLFMSDSFRPHEL